MSIMKWRARRKDKSKKVKDSKVCVVRIFALILAHTV